MQQSDADEQRQNTAQELKPWKEESLIAPGRNLANHKNDGRHREKRNDIRNSTDTEQHFLHTAMCTESGEGASGAFVCRALLHLVDGCKLRVEKGFTPWSIWARILRPGNNKRLLSPLSENGLRPGKGRCLLAAENVRYRVFGY